MKVLIVLSAVATLATVFGSPAVSSTTNAPASSTSGSDGVKTEAAGGRHHRRRHDDSSEEDFYDYRHHFYPPLIQDRFVCDLDASVLLVVGKEHRRHHSYGGANRAVRVKCSEVANFHEDSCNACCQQTARRDTTLANDKLFGFLAVTKNDDDKTFTRNKRATDDDDDDEPEGRDVDGEGRKSSRRWHKVESTYLENVKWAPHNYHTNLKCVCCAPRTNPPAASNPGNTYSSPPAAASPSVPYGSANTFQAPQPIAAAQPVVDAWQSADSAAWGAAAADVVAAAPAATPAPNVNQY